MSVAEEIRRQCQEKGSDAALAFGKPGPDTLSYGQLGHYVDSISARLHRQGIGTGTICGLSVEAPIVHVALLLALERLGAATLTMRSESDAQSVKLGLLFTDGPPTRGNCPVQRVDPSWFSDTIEYPAPPTREPSPDSICRIAFTSGSSGKPKPVALTYGMLNERMLKQNLHRGEIYERATRAISLLGIDAMTSYRVLMRTLRAGGLFCFFDSNIPRGVNRIRMYKVQYIKGTPLQLAELVTYGEKHPNSFPTLEIVHPTGARTTPEFAERLRKHVCPNVVVGYGSTERGSVARGLVGDVDLSRGDVGRIIPGVEVEIVDENDRPVTNALGRVRVITPGGPEGYYGEPPGQNPSFKGKWFYPGDMGRLSPDGMLSIAGRADRLINLGGMKTTLDDAEAILRKGPGVKEMVLEKTEQAGIDRLIAFVVPQPDWSEPKFWDYCRKLTDNSLYPVKLVVLHRLPLGPSGKVDRKHLPGMER